MSSPSLFLTSPSPSDRLARKNARTPDSSDEEEEEEEDEAAASPVSEDNSVSSSNKKQKTVSQVASIGSGGK